MASAPADQLPPATGAWMPGDPVGHRQFFTFAADRPFALDGGVDAARRHRRLRDVGHARRQRVATPCCCATRGPATATPPARPVAAIPSAGWWEGVVGPGLAIDTDRWFVVCANVLGGCQGTHRAGVAASGRRPAVRQHGSRW